MSSENSYADGEVDEVPKNSLMKEGANHYKAKRYKEALEAYERAIRLDPGNVAAYVGKGNSLRKLKQYSDALCVYEQAISLDPNNVSAYNGKCYLYVSTADYDNAWLAHKKAVQLNPRSAAAYNGKGQILERQERYEEALQAFEEVIRLATNTDNIAGYYYNKGLVLCDLVRYGEALEASDQAIRLDPENSVYRTKISCVPKEERDKKIYKYYDNGKMLSTLNRYEEALQAFDKALRIDFEYTPAHVGRGNALLKLERYEEALQAFEKALQLHTTHAFAYEGKGNALLKLKCYEQALESYDKALQLNSKLVQAHVGKGHALFALQRSMDALKAYGTAIDLNTDDIDCYKNAGDILIDLGPEYNEQAIQTYAKALHFVPELVSAHLAQGNALFELKRYDESLAAYKQVITLDKSNAFAYLGIGDILAARNSYEIATECYEKALQLIRNEQNPDLLWSLVYPVRTSCRPAHIQFELLQHFVVNAPPDPHKDEALRCIGKLYNKLFDDHVVPPDVLQNNLQVLRTLVQNLPEEKRAEALTLIANGDDTRIARLLIHLAPYSFPGLATLAHQVTLCWVPGSCSDDLGIRFYHVLDAYGVPFEDSDWLFVQELVEEELYIQAKSILSDLLQMFSGS